MNILYIKYALGRVLSDLLFCRKADSWMVRLALLLITALLAGWIILGMQSAIAWVFASLVLAVLLLLAQSSLRQIRKDFEEDIEQQVLVIGVGDTKGLITAVPAHIRGQRVSYELPHPTRSLNHLMSVEQKINEALHYQSSAGVKVIYAGQAPLPIAFLMGFYLGNTRIDAIMDKTASHGSWQLLDALDDGAGFETHGLEQLKPGMREVTIMLHCDGAGSGTSINDESARSSHQYPNGDIVVSMMLAGSTQDSLSASKQICLANQFAAVLHALADHGVATVHLHYAGPHSLLFNLGRQYRRLQQPAIIVYSLGNGLSEPWGLRIPASAHEAAKIIAADHVDQPSKYLAGLPAIGGQFTPKACGLSC